jgi:hypothetical protein
VKYSKYFSKILSLSKQLQMDRRSFLSNTAMATAAISLPANEIAKWASQNKLPAWKGFNLLDFFSPNPANSRGVTTEDHFRQGTYGLSLLP